MNPEERVTLIREIAASLSPGEWGDIDLVLREFGFATAETWNDSAAEYVRSMVGRGADDELRRLHAFLYSAPDPGSPAPTNLELWEHRLFPRQRFFRLFISHTHAYKVQVAALKMALFKYGIVGFVAHEDIRPNDEWQQAIEQALVSCDALLAYLTDDFPASNWCDQEVGVVFGANRLVVPLTIDINPYGFIGKYQRVRGHGLHPETAGSAVAEIIRTNERSRQIYAEVLVDRLYHAYSYDNARAVFENVRRIPRELWTDEMLASARAAAETNQELIDGFWESTTVALATLELLDSL